MRWNRRITLNVVRYHLGDNTISECKLEWIAHQNWKRNRALSRWNDRRISSITIHWFNIKTNIISMLNKNPVTKDNSTVVYKTIRARRCPWNYNRIVNSCCHRWCAGRRFNCSQHRKFSWKRWISNNVSWFYFELISRSTLNIDVGKVILCCHSTVKNDIITCALIIIQTII